MSEASVGGADPSAAPSCGRGVDDDVGDGAIHRNHTAPREIVDNRLAGVLASMQTTLEASAHWSKAADAQKDRC